MVKNIGQTIAMIAFLLLVAIGMFSFHVITGNIIGHSNKVEISVKDFRMDNSSQVNEGVDLNGTQNISRPK